MGRQSRSISQATQSTSTSTSTIKLYRILLPTKDSPICLSQELTARPPPAAPSLAPTVVLRLAPTTLLQPLQQPPERLVAASWAVAAVPMLPPFIISSADLP